MTTSPSDKTYLVTSNLTSFTATGRPYQAHRTSGSGLHALASAESFGAGPPNLVPRQYTDASIISVPVLPPRDDTTGNKTTTDQNVAARSSGLSSFIRRASRTKPKKLDFVMREMTRGEYLKYYAKDEGGRYVGSEDPAEDCILNHEEDRVKYKSALQFKHDIL